MPRALSFDQLKHGYVQTLENGVRFFSAATELSSEFPDKALALAELAQEEIGRSLTFLAGFHIGPALSEWRWFWDGWNKHELKAHRAYLYEAISPMRIEMASPDGRRFAGEPLKPKIFQEKESGSYVDFDAASGRFVAPWEQVSMVEAMARTSTLMYLSLTADAVRRGLLTQDAEFRLRAFGEIAFRICSENLYQQDMPAVFQEFRARSPRHNSLCADLDTALSANSKFVAAAIGHTSE